MAVAQLAGARRRDGARARRRDRVRAPDEPDHGERRRDSTTARGRGGRTRRGSTDVRGALRQGDAGAYVNFLADEGEARVRAAYPGATWERLATVKARYDPANLFRLNQNIPPAGGTGCFASKIGGLRWRWRASCARRASGASSSAAEVADLVEQIAALVRGRASCAGPASSRGEIRALDDEIGRLQRRLADASRLSARGRERGRLNRR